MERKSAHWEGPAVEDEVMAAVGRDPILRLRGTLGNQSF